jgi:hypothetical protein
VHQRQEPVDHVHELRVRRDRQAGDDRGQVEDEHRREGGRIPQYQRAQPGHREQEQPGQQRVATPGQRGILAGLVRDVRVGCPAP